MDTLYSDFDGQGPDIGEKGILFNCPETKNNVYVWNVLVNVSAMPHYVSMSAYKNGRHGPSDS